MKKKNAIIIAIVLVFLIVLLEGRFLLNITYVKDFEKENAVEWKVQVLSLFNLYQPYIAPKNYGDYYYQKGEYEKAVEKYDKALTHFVPKKKACDIRINAALSILKMVNDKEKEKAKQLLERAKKYVGDDDCMSLSFFNQQTKDDAEKVEEEIEKKMQEIENSAGGDEGEEDDSDDQDDSNDPVENPKIKEIKDTNQSAQESRDDNMGKYQDDYDPNYKGKPW